MCLFCVCAVLRLGRGLSTSWSLVQGVLPSVYRSGHWKAARAHKGCRVIQKIRGRRGGLLAPVPRIIVSSLFWSSSFLSNGYQWLTYLKWSGRSLKLNTHLHLTRGPPLQSCPLSRPHDVVLNLAQGQLCAVRGGLQASGPWDVSKPQFLKNLKFIPTRKAGIGPSLASGELASYPMNLFLPLFISSLSNLKLCSVEWLDE
jgi:hypothetical protein